MTSFESNSPATIALAGFPPGVARLVGWDATDGVAFVLLDVGPPEYRYAYAVWLEEINGRWEETHSGNADGGWRAAPRDGTLGMLVDWDEVSPDADLVRIKFGSETRDVTVHDGIYLTTWKEIPDPSDTGFPEEVAIRVRGEWGPVTGPRILWRPFFNRDAAP
jgi:hypothetical protein